MPRRDGTGPRGARSMTGRGLGLCTGANALKFGAGFEARLGHGRNNNNINQTSSKTQKEMLQEQKDLLQSRLEVIDKQLENL